MVGLKLEQAPDDLSCLISPKSSKDEKMAHVEFTFAISSPDEFLVVLRL